MSDVVYMVLSKACDQSPMGDVQNVKAHENKKMLVDVDMVERGQS